MGLGYVLAYQSIKTRSGGLKMAKAKRKPRKPTLDGEKLNPFAEQHGAVIYQFTHHAESGTVRKTQRRTVSNIIDEWLEQGGLGYEEPQRHAINYCLTLWHKAGVRGKLSAKYGERLSAGGDIGKCDDAINELHRIKSWFPQPYWEIFENVVRWGEPAGTAGSKMAENGPQRRAAAKATVGFVASIIATRLGY